MRRLNGLRHLVHDLVEKTTDLVEEQHTSVAEKPAKVLGAVAPALGEAARAVTQVERAGAAVVYDAVRAVNAGVRAATDRGVGALLEGLSRALVSDAARELAPLAAPPPELAKLSVLADGAQGALNGLVGDFLRGSGNALALPMTLHAGGDALPIEERALRKRLPDASPRLAIFVHGLCCTDQTWGLFSEELHGAPGLSFGTLLQGELGFTPVYVRYNTGLHVSENGRDLDRILERLVAAHPVPVEQVVLVGHSMGGLVARSAAHYGDRRGASWAGRLTHLFCLGSPHLGAPLEKAGNLLSAVLRSFDTPGTRVPAAVLDARSSGIKDLRHGYVVDEDWIGRDPDAPFEDGRTELPFVGAVLYCFIAGTLTADPEHPVGRLLGDVLVRLPSAAGVHTEPSRSIPFHRGAVIGRAHHLAIMNHPAVYAELRRWLVEAPGGLPRPELSPAGADALPG
ncbi:MAG: alpha/beta fold hydrolase [Deltaproteobacteria bacterium]|nr:alpha/beta fold hydrolase [Deltaproteobacteria bacterium]